MSLVNVPSFVYRSDQNIEVPVVGRLAYAVAFCGAFYVFCDAGSLRLQLTPENNGRLIDSSLRLDHAQDHLSRVDADANVQTAAHVVGPNKTSR